MELPPKPEPPCPADCCGNGCTHCVFDIYDDEIRIYSKECLRIRLGQFKQDTELETVIDPTEYRKFTLLNIKSENVHTNIYRFCIENNRCLNIAPGQHLLLRGFNQDDYITRKYTPIKSAEGYFDVMIKLYPHGKMSAIVKEWKIGQAAEWRGPFGDFFYEPNKHKHIVCLAAGTGIAPMVSVIQTILDNEEDETKLFLMYGCQSYDDILLKELIDNWSDYWNFNSSIFLSQDSPENSEKKRKFRESVFYRRLSESDVSCFDRELDDILILICGTLSFNDDMIRYCKRAGVCEDSYLQF